MTIEKLEALERAATAVSKSMDASSVMVRMDQKSGGGQ